MKFFRFFSKKQQEEAPQPVKDPWCDGYREVMVQHRDMHMEYLVQQGRIRYKHVISPTDACRSFPEGYFDVKEAALSVRDQVAVEARIRTALTECPLSDHMDLLPPGASHGALMICTKVTGEKECYSNCRMGNGGFSIVRDPIAQPFLELFQTLYTFCDFAPSELLKR